MRETSASGALREVRFRQLSGGKKLGINNLAPRVQHKSEHGCGESKVASFLYAVNRSGTR